MKYGSISGGSKEAVEAAKQIFYNGGNAFDAGIGAVFTSMTSEFSLTGAGGGGIMLGMSNNDTPVVYDFFVDCPSNNNNKIDFQKINVDFGNTSQDFHIGKGSTATPGNIAGLLDIHQEKGVLPLNIILEPAIKIAKEGVKLSKYQAYINQLIKPILLHSQEGYKLFHTNNKFLQQGDTFKNPNFSDFLYSISRYGKKFFYEGDGADIINKFYSSEGYINKKELKNYQMKIRKPNIINIGEYKIFTNPAPSYGGTLMIFMLKLLKKSNKLNADMTQLVKSMELTSMARNSVCSNPNNEMEINNVLEKKIFSEYLDLFNDNNFIGNTSKLSGLGSTTHISIIDKWNNIVSVTTTNGEGCGHFIPEFGIMMNNMLGEQDLNPYGFHNWEKQRRLPTMICPTIIFKNNKPLYVLGSGGSNRIRSAIIQVVLNLIVKNMPLEEAINASRVHLEGKELYFEPEIKIPTNKYFEHIKKIPFEKKSLFFGGVNCVSINNAIGDNRRGGIGKVI